MQAARIEGPRSIAVGRAPVPEPGPGETRVRISACGICGSDLHLYRLGFFAPGTTPGHEMAGVVDALGDGVEGPATGTPVAVEPLRTCGRCACCASGRDAICPDAQMLGVHGPGGLAEYALVDAVRLFPVPEALDGRLAALAEPMAVVVHGLKRGGFAPGQRVLVLGAGAVGLLAVAAARHLGAGEIWATARHPHQAAGAAALGADRVLTESEATPAALAGMGREAPIDLALETVGGTADTLDAAAAALRPGGVVSVLGFFTGRISLDTLPLLLKEISLVWSYCYGRERPDAPRARGSAADADFARAIEILTAQRDSLLPLVTHTVPLEQVSRAFELAADKRAGAVKVSVVPPSSA